MQSCRTADTEWNFVLRALRRLLLTLRPKLVRFAHSDKGLRSGAMLAHKENSNVSTCSAWPPRNFCCTGYSTIINIARTLLTKACKSGFYLIVAFWLRFLFVAELIWAVAAIFHSEANTAGSEWDRFPGFSAYQVFASWTHVSECSGCSPMQANACCESKQTTICENRGRRSLSLPDLYSAL